MYGSSNTRNSLNLLVVEFLSITLRQSVIIVVNFILRIEYKNNFIQKEKHNQFKIRIYYLSKILRFNSLTSSFRQAWFLVLAFSKTKYIPVTQNFSH